MSKVCENMIKSFRARIMFMMTCFVMRIRIVIMMMVRNKAMPKQNYICKCEKQYSCIPYPHWDEDRDLQFIYAMKQI